MRRRIAIPLLAALIAAGAAGYGAWHYFPRERTGTALVLYGNVDVRTVDLAFKVAGRIAAMPVDEGDHVTRGATVAVLDRRYFDNDLRIARAREAVAAANLAKLENGSRPEEIAEARADVALARATMENDAVTLARQRRLMLTNVASLQNYDNAAAAARVSAAQLARAEMALKLAVLGPRQEDIAAARAERDLEAGNVAVSTQALADATLAAPADGIILSRVEEPGAIVAAGATVFTLALDRPVWVRAYVSERALGRVRPGMAASVTTDTAPNQPYRGHVGFISPVAEFTPKTVETPDLRTDLVYRLRIIIDHPNQGLRQGMPVTVTLGQGG